MKSRRGRGRGRGTGTRERRKRSPRRDAHSPDDAGPRKPPEPVAPRRDREEIMRDLAAIRAEWHWEDEPEMDLYVHTRGGGWTDAHRHVAANETRPRPRRGVPSAWCRAFEWPVNLTYSFNEHGMEACHQLAREVCRRAQWFYSMWLDSDAGEDFVYTEDDLQSYPGNLEYVTWARDPALMDTTTFNRIMQIRTILQRN